MLSSYKDEIVNKLMMSSSIREEAGGPVPPTAVEVNIE